jgi:hypothetical protein
MSTIKIKRSQTAAAQPASLAYGELAINITDKKIFIGNSSGATTLLIDGNAIGGSTSTETIQDAAASLFTTGTHTGISISYPDTNNAINLTNTGVLSFNTRTGAVSLTSSDVTTALGFTPVNFLGYDYEIHVSQVDGNDTTGNGDLLTPVASITKALTLVGSQRKTIIVHPGTYTESPSITVQYTTITGPGLIGGNIVISGTVSTNTGCTISGIKMTNLTVTTPSGAGNVNILNCEVSGTFTKSSNADYTVLRLCDLTSASITGAGLVAIFGGNPNFITVNNASANVIVKSAVTVSPVLTAGALSIVDCVVGAAVTNAVTSAASSVITLANSQFLTSNLGGVAPVVLNGFYSILNCVYDKPNSTLVATSGTGGTTNSIDYFQYINADKFITQGGTSAQFVKGDGSLDSINALTIGTGLSGSSYNGSTGVTIAIDSTVATLTGNQTLTNKTLTSPTINSPTISNLYLSDGLILVEGTTNDSNEMSLVVGTLTADRTITFPNATGTVITTGNLTSITSTGTIASGTWNGTAIGTVYGGTGLTSYTLGDLIYSSASNTLSKLSGNTTSTKKFLAQTGTGTVSAAPSWTTLTSTDVGLGNVENTALSTWAGSSNITTVGNLVGLTLNTGFITINTGETETLYINNTGNTTTYIGDVDGSGNGTYIVIDDALGTITLNSVGGIDNSGAAFNSSVTGPSFTDTYSVIRTYRTTTSSTTDSQTIATVSGVYSVADGMNYSAFEVTVSAWDTVALKGEMLKMLVMQDGSNTVNTQYGYIRTGATSIVSSYTTGLTGVSNKSLQIKATPLSANSTNFTVTVRYHIGV